MPRGEPGQRRPARADCSLDSRELLSKPGGRWLRLGWPGESRPPGRPRRAGEQADRRGIGADLDRIVDVCAPPRRGVEPARRAHPGPCQFDSQRRIFPVQVIEDAAGGREMEQMPAGEISFHRDTAWGPPVREGRRHGRRSCSVSGRPSPGRRRLASLIRRPGAWPGVRHKMYGPVEVIRQADAASCRFP
jgi:hypothetical protein